MSYNVYKTDGNLLTTVDNGTLNNTTSISLVGIGYNSYSEIIAESFVHLMENFASLTPPLAPLIGQLWYDKQHSKLFVYNGVEFKLLNTVNLTQPTNPTNGDFWYDSVNAQLKMYANGLWGIVAPAYNSTQGKSGQIIETVADLLGSNHTVTSFYNANNLVATFATDSFSPQNYGTVNNIVPGLNLQSTYEIKGVISNARVASGLASFADSTYMHSNANTSTIGTLTVSNNYGLTVGNTSTLSISRFVDVDAAVYMDIYSPIENIRLKAGTGPISSRIYIKPNGRIGVNTESPQVDFDIHGDLAVDGSIYNVAGYVNPQNGIYWTNEYDTYIKHTSANLLIMQHNDALISLNSNGHISLGSSVTLNGTTTANDISIIYGNVSVNNAPASAFHLTNKNYVDNSINSAKLPIGSVIMWYGSSGSVPSGWQICDGTNGTPNLIDKFVFGAGGTQNYGNIGGTNSQTATTSSGGGHYHTGNITANGSHTHDIVISDVPAHTHDFYDLYAIQDDVAISKGNYNIINGVPTFYPYSGNLGSTTNALTNRPNGAPTEILADADGKYVQPSFYFPSGDFGTGTQFFYQNQEGGTNPAANDQAAFAFKNRTLSTGAGPITIQSNAATVTTGFTTDVASPHTHSVSFDNRPAWVALYYIMRVS